MPDLKKTRYRTENQSHKLLPEEQLELARRIAWFWSNQQCSKFVQEQYKKDLNVNSFYEMKNSPKWIPVIEQFREEYISKCAEIPLFHKRRRLEELQEIYEHFKAAGEMKEARLTLKEFQDEAEGRRGDISFNFTQVTHNEFHQMTDEDLQKEKMKTLEQLEKVRKLKLLTNSGSRNVIQEIIAEEIKEGEETA